MERQLHRERQLHHHSGEEHGLNGLGETPKTHARPVLHSSGQPIAWKALDDCSGAINPWGVLRHVLANTWQLRRFEGPVHPTRRPVDDPVALTAEVKMLARRRAEEGPA